MKTNKLNEQAEGDDMTSAETAGGSGPDKAAPPLLEVRDLQVEFKVRDNVTKAVNGVSYSVNAGETLAVLGESGSGKSVTAQAIMGILDSPPGRISGGEIYFKGAGNPVHAGERAPQAPRCQDGDDLPGRAVLAQPRALRRLPAG